MGAAEFIDGFLDAQEWETTPEEEAASERLRARHAERQAKAAGLVPDGTPYTNEGRTASGCSWLWGHPGYLPTTKDDDL